MSGEARSVAVPEPPETARQVFGPVLPMARAYAELLVGAGIERGLIGPGEAQRIWDRHLLNCAGLAELVPVPCRLADLGSGAGLPGLVLAMLLPEVDVVLVEPMERRTTFLVECVSALGLGNVEVKRGRAEDYAGRIEADVVTARAVAELGRLAVLAAWLARPGGLVLALKGATAARELSQARPVLDRLGVTAAEVVEAGGGAGGLASQSRPGGTDPSSIQRGSATVIRFRTSESTGAPARGLRTEFGRSTARSRRAR